jgi:8-oxo-dGTP pyrophosphatase MutT (NUDIX family)
MTGPAYLSILVTAKVMGTLMLLVFETWQPPPLVLAGVFGWRRRHGPLPLAQVQGADRRGAMGQTDARVLTDKTAIRDAATIIVLREDGGTRRVLMGQRGKSAAFMPSKFVFPGGAVDAVDATIPLASPSAPDAPRRLAAETGTPPEAVIAAATRELWEETGLLLGAPDPRAATSTRRRAGAAISDRAPALGDALTFIFRAITPPGRPRRFDARFLLARAEDLRQRPRRFLPRRG